MKRLIVGGYEKVFEIGRIFRNEGMDAEHLQDYTQMEFYWAYADYDDLMRLTEEMFTKMIKEVFGKNFVVCEGKKIVFKKPTNTVISAGDEILLDEKMISEKGISNLVTTVKLEEKKLMEVPKK